MPREDNVKNECGYRAVFTEQGASASHMAAARFLDTISNILGMTGEAGVVVSAYPQVRMADASRLLKLPESACPEISVSILPRQRSKTWDRIDDLVVPLARNLYGHSLARVLWKRNFEEVPHGSVCQDRVEKVPTWECLYKHPKLVFLSEWTILRLSRKLKTSDACGTVWRKKLILKIQRQ